MSKKPAKDDQVTLAAKALRVKNAGAALEEHPATEDHSNPGTKSVSRPDYPPSGDFDAEGQRPVLERSRKER